MHLESGWCKSSIPACEGAGVGGDIVVLALFVALQDIRRTPPPGVPGIYVLRIDRGSQATVPVFLYSLELE